MQAYSIVLFVHLLSMLLAAGAAALSFFAALQLRGAASGPDVVRWGRLAKAVAPCFPIATLLLAGTGAYLTQTRWHWTSPWIDAGLAGLVLLFVCGSRVEASRARALAREVRRSGMSPRARALLRDPVAWSAKTTTVALTVAIVFVMVVKPSGLGSALAIVLAVLLGPVAALPFWRVRDERGAAASAAPAE